MLAPAGELTCSASPAGKPTELIGALQHEGFRLVGPLGMRFVQVAQVVAELRHETIARRIARATRKGGDHA